MFPDFFMHIGQALDLVSRYDSLRNPLTSLGDYLDPELISRCLAESGRIPELMRDLASMGQLVKLPTRRERAFPRVVKERPWKYPTAPKKSQSVA
ncbi:hypothetical protein BWR58_03710 [Shigella sonnei]|nr:hypothetical protein BWR58_03710 [Shigella sonnei]